MLGDHGFTSKVLPYEPSAHVPFWFYGPGIRPGTNSSLVSNLDIFPTLVHLAGLRMPKNIHGQNLVPILEGKKKKVREFFIYEGLGSYGGSKPNLTVITPKYKYIKTYSDSSLKHIEFTEIYNQNMDSEEMDNLANKYEYVHVIT